MQAKFQERKCWYHEISIRISWFKEKIQVRVYVLHTWIAEKIELGLEISLSLSGLLTTLEPETGCHWHANFFTAQTPFTVSIGCLFPLLDCCETLTKPTRWCQADVQHNMKNVAIFWAWQIFCFPREISAMLPCLSQPVWSPHVPMFRSTGGRRRRSSCPCSQPVSSSSSIPWPA